MILNSNQRIPLIPTPLRHADPASPWCYTASLGANTNINMTTPSIPKLTNFLSTQVWPSSRTASLTIEKHCRSHWAVCELGCGPGLPSLTAARLGCRVVATDLDEVALEMVRLAAEEQGHVDDRFDTFKFDLTGDIPLPEADLYVLSDVFESAAVAEGAAEHVLSVLDTACSLEGDESPRVWVFAQSDRAQRDIFLATLQRVDRYRDLEWTMDHDPPSDAMIWLFDLNEIDVQYH